MSVKDNYSDLGKAFPAEDQIGNQFSPKNLKPEEVKMYRDCVSGLYFKIGLPFALLCDYLSTRNSGGFFKGNYLKRGVIFAGNVFIAGLVFSPTCFYKLLAVRKEAMEREKEMDLQGLRSTSLGGEEIQTGLRPPDDFSYPADLNLGEPDSNFSTDFSTSELVRDDDKEGKIRATTYDELRARHRSRYANKPSASPSSLNFESEPTSGVLSSPIGKPEQTSSAPPLRKVTRNKYGDEIE